MDGQGQVFLGDLPFTCFKFHSTDFSLVSTFSKKHKTYKMGHRVCVSVCVCVCVCLCVSVYSFGPPLTISIPVMRLIRNFVYIFIKLIIDKDLFIYP